MRATQSPASTTEQKLATLELDHAILASQYREMAKAKQIQGLCLRHLQRQLELQHLYQVVCLRHSVPAAYLLLVVARVTQPSARGE